MPTPPIILIKKKSGHGGHHGGAWKVAYADFVTAMMALFIVLWLLSSATKQEKMAISGYFKDPSGTAAKLGTTLAGSGENIQLSKEDMAKLKEQLQKSIQKMIDLEKLKKNIEMTVTSEGLRIELIESEKGTFFNSGSAQLNGNGKELLTVLAAELGKVPNHISVEGHTDAKPFSGKSNYTNWELSSDRANAARRVMQDTGLRQNQIAEVRGYADSTGSQAYNLQLTQHRAETVMHYMQSHGLSNRMSAKGFGKEDPIADNATREGRLANRRVELHITGGDRGGGS